MQNITEISQFDAAVPYVEVTDPVIGGSAGESNLAVTALANRTRFLYNHAGGFTAVAELNAAANIDDTYLRKLIYINVTGNTAFTIATLGWFLVGQSLTIKVKCPSGKCVSFTPNGAEQFTNGQTTKTKEWLCDGEEITLVKRNNTQWEIINALGNFANVGNDVMVRFMPINTVQAIGQTVNRADYERLWNTIQSTAIAEATWLSHTLNYRCFFSDGDGVSTFRLPDMRAMHWRALDLGRGIDLARIGSGAGGYAADEIKAHTHTLVTLLVQHTASAATIGVTDGPLGGAGTKTYTTASTGGTENTVKTTGLIPVIYY